MKAKLANILFSILTIFLFIFILDKTNFFTTYAQYGAGCGNRLYISVFVEDEAGNRFGKSAITDEEGHSCVGVIPASRAGVDIVGGPSQYVYNGTTINNAIDKEDPNRMSLWKCSDDENRYRSGGFEIRSGRPCEIPASPRGLAFKLTLPAPYSCSNVTWQRIKGATVQSSGVGCDISTPFPPDDYDFYILAKINTAPTPTPVPTTFIPAEPGGRSYTCNTDGTVSLRWGAVSGASTYIPRLNKAPLGDWRNLGAGDTGANAPGSISQIARYPITYGTQYQWAVSSATSSNVQSTWSWTNFVCDEPPHIKINVKNPQGTPVQVRGLAYTYDCGPYPMCLFTVNQYQSSVDSGAIGGYEGGAGISLDTNEVVLGITPAPAGGVSQVRNNGGSGGGSWANTANWYTYWWPSYPNTGFRTVNFVVASPTPTPTPFCTDSDHGIVPNTLGNTRAWLTSGTNNTLTDSCGATFVAGSTTYKTTVIEYSCLPAGGTNGSGTTRTSTAPPGLSCAAGRGCLNGACVCMPITSPSAITIATRTSTGNVTPGNRLISWNAVAGASRYALRIDDESNGTDADPCTSGKPGDICSNPTGNSFTYNFLAGRSYRVWVHAVSACNGSFSAASALSTSQTPYCTDSDGGPVTTVSGSTQEWLSNGTTTTLIDTCGGGLLGGVSNSMTNTVMEYSCLPAGGTNGSGTTRTSTAPPGTACAAGRGCYNGACQTAPDLTISSITRTGSYTIRYCNTGTAGAPAGTTFRVRFTNTLPNPDVVQTPTTLLTVPAVNACANISVSCASLGDSSTCDEATSITGEVDVSDTVVELNDTNNIFTLNFPAVADELFYKLKNASLHRLRAIDVPIPDTMQIFNAGDPDDDASAATGQHLIIGAAGVITSTGTRTRIIPNSNSVSTNNWKKDDTQSYAESTGGFLQNLPRFVEYSKSQKKNKTITSMAEIGSTTVNIFGTGAQTLTISAQPPGTMSNSVLLVYGNITITAAAGPSFNSAGKSLAIIATGTITIDPSITNINAILIADTINLGTSANRLKIKGNLITDNVIDPIPRDGADLDIPNLFIVFDPKMYMDLLPYLNEVTLNGRQVE